MALRRVLAGLVIVLVVLLGCSLLAVGISVARHYGHDNGGDIEGPGFKQLSKKLDDPDLKYLAANRGAKSQQFLRP